MQNYEKRLKKTQFSAIPYQIRVYSDFYQRCLVSNSSSIEFLYRVGMVYGMEYIGRYNLGWASHKYREYYSVWPNAHKGTPAIKPDIKEIKNILTHILIKSAKAYKKRAA
jgi:hypothetical protein